MSKLLCRNALVSVGPASRRSGRGLPCSLSSAAPIEKPERVLGPALEPGFLGNVGPGRVSAPGGPIRQRYGDDGGLSLLRAAARSGHQRSGPRRLWIAVAILYLAQDAGADRAPARTAQAADRSPGLAGRAWTAGWLLVPLPVLFHPYFLRGVVWPLIGMGG